MERGTEKRRDNRGKGKRSREKGKIAQVDGQINRQTDSKITDR